MLEHKSPTRRPTGELMILLAMAGPLMAAQLSKVVMVFTDTYMMGRLGAEALAGGGVGASIYSFLTFSFSGVISGIGTLIAIAHGSQDITRVRRSCQSGLLIALLLAALGMLVLWLAAPLLRSLGQPPQSIDAFIAFTHAVAFALPGYLVFMALRNFVSALGDTKPVMVISMAGAVLNLALNLVIINQWFGIPFLGLRGIGAVTASVSLLMAVSLAGYIALTPRYQPYRIFEGILDIDWGILRQALRFGIPVGLSFAIELSLFTCAALMMGHFGVVVQAAHHVAMQAVLIAFVVPISLSSATSYRVGQLVGAGRVAETKRVARIGLACGAVASLIFAPLFLVFPTEIASLFVHAGTADSLLLKSTVASLLAVAVWFLLFDGAQNILLGALRGLKALKTSLALVAIFYWAIALPTAYGLGIHLELGPRYIWAGLAIGLAAATFAMYLGLELIVNRQTREAQVPRAVVLTPEAKGS
ncbi:NorM family multidrug efflux MATE transporter [Pseudomonas entomophila]|uniref:NorM family multidrug efflux MATE transporter n=1 Tax=Pseudomonas entomophila TaxID=312306 RepID=UPI001BD033D8|nr:NorM family multidrug efflux MATE transporter [Pseudomonas entomophila]QVM93725.1 NorM family multidrug efflux MATE transporter [Pseudomonas entomophila]